MKLKSISVGGYKNIKYTKLSMNRNKIAVLSPNNYGKSNLLEAIRFGTEFISAGAKLRTSMMAWTNGIPLTPSLANEPFQFEIELEDQSLGEYCYVRYGFSFLWYRDDGSGQRIIDERLEMRKTEGVKYTAYLKRGQGKYRKGKSTNSFRKIVLAHNVLALDVISSVEDLEYADVLNSILHFEYRVCDTLDVGEQFRFNPFCMAEEDEKKIRFDDEDVPRALHQLKKIYPDQYLMFEDAVYTLFPEFSEISVQEHELSGKSEYGVVYAGKVQGLSAEEMQEKVPFHLKDKVYRVEIHSSYLNQPVNLSSMSSGTKRIIWLLANIFVASCTNVSCIGVEELETSIHPKMLKSLLEIINDVLEDTSMIISSHSPYLAQYLKLEQIYVGASKQSGTAQFFPIQTSKMKKMVSAAYAYGLSVGEYLFELMSGGEQSLHVLKNYLEGFSSGM